MSKMFANHDTFSVLPEITENIYLVRMSPYICDMDHMNPTLSPFNDLRPSQPHDQIRCHPMLASIIHITHTHTHKIPIIIPVSYCR